MGLVFSGVGRPRGRGRIERFFETVNQLCLSALPDYIAPGGRRPTPRLTLRELDSRLGEFFLAEYHHRVHGETGARPQTQPTLWLRIAAISVAIS